MAWHQTLLPFQQQQKMTKNIFFRKVFFSIRKSHRTGPDREKKNRKISALRITGPVAGIRHRARVAGDPAPGYHVEGHTA